MTLAMPPTNAQWVVETARPLKDGENGYVLREVSGTGRKDLQTSATSASISKSLVAEHLDMLKRLADR